MGPYEKDGTIGKEIFLIGEVGAKTQELADNIAAVGRVSCIHLPYPDQKGTGGNFAMPLTPLEISLGPYCQFCIYHLMEVDDPAKYFPFYAVDVGVSSDYVVKRDAKFGLDAPGTGYHLDLISREESPGNAGQTADTELKKLLAEGDGIEPDGKVALPKLAKILRSKNSGPYEICFDIIFYNLDCLDRAEKSGELSREKMAKLYRLPEDRIIACQFFRQAKAYKCTIPRDGIAGSFGDRDLHASQQYIPLFNVRV